MNHQGDVTSSGRHAIDIWHVRLSNGETRGLSLDELDAAFDAGWVDERTPVLPAGAIHWKTLGEVAGLDETPAPVSSVPSSIAPLALDVQRDVDSAPSPPLDAESDAEVLAFRPRRGKKLLGLMTGAVLIAGLGFAGFRARPALERALGAHAAAKAAAVAPPPQAPAQPPAPALAPSPSPSPSPPPSASAAIPTLTTTALPNAPPGTDKDKPAVKKDPKAKRPSKRAK